MASIKEALALAEGVATVVATEGIHHLVEVLQE